MSMGSDNHLGSLFSHPGNMHWTVEEGLGGLLRWIEAAMSRGIGMISSGREEQRAEKAKALEQQTDARRRSEQRTAARSEHRRQWSCYLTTT